MVTISAFVSKGLLAVGLWIFSLTTFAGDGVQFFRTADDDVMNEASIFAIYQDRLGYLWMGSQTGLYRYDGHYYRPFVPDPEDSSSMPSNDVNQITEDGEGRLWVATSGGGIAYTDPARLDGFTRFLHDSQQPESIPSNRVRRLLVDRKGRLWVGSSRGVAYFNAEQETFRPVRALSQDIGGRLNRNEVLAMMEAEDGRIWIGFFGGGAASFDPDDPETSIRYFRHDPDDPRSLSHGEVRSLMQDQEGVIWVGSHRGLNRLDEDGGFTRFFADPENPQSLSNDEIRFLHQVEEQIWIGTPDGLNRFDPKTGLAQVMRHDPEDPYSLPINVTRTLFEDRSGLLWIGTIGAGACFTDLRQKGFSHLGVDPNDPRALNFPLTRDVALDSNNGLWIASDGGVAYRDPQTQRIKTYAYDPQNEEGLAAKEVLSLLVDSKDRVWVGVYNGGLHLLEDPQTGRFSRLQYQPGAEGPTSNRIMVLAEDGQGMIWMGHNGAGLDRYDPQRGEWRNFSHDPENPNSLVTNQIRLIQRDREGILWIGGLGGLSAISTIDGERYDFQNFAFDPSDPNALGHNAVVAMLEPRRGADLWFGTHGGLSRFQRDQNIFTQYTRRDGLPDEIIYAMLEDAQGFFWLGTNRGISRFDPQTETFRNYDQRDGLRTLRHDFGDALALPDGRFLFAGHNGLTFFDPLNIRDDTYKPTIDITVVTRDHKPLATRDDMTLDHRNTMLAFDFALLDFAAPNQATYEYRLKPLENDWIATDADNRRATYTTLPAGDYTFQVRGLNKEGVSSQTTTLDISVKPAPWRTIWAYLLYVLILAGIAAYFLRVERQKLEAERSVVRRLKQVDRLKDEFLAITTHELRTPLNGMIGLAEALGHESNHMPARSQASLRMIVDSGRRLAFLVNDLLDFSRLRQDSLKIHPTTIELAPIIQEVLVLAGTQIGEKSLTMHQDVSDPFPPLKADETRLHQILLNLVTNAVKFTQEGHIRIIAKTAGAFAEITVTDTGVGIAEEHQQQIFESFEQLEHSSERTAGGAGLGLSIVKQLVNLHGGEILVASKPGDGSAFTFTIPLAEYEAVTAHHLAVKARASTQPVMNQQTLSRLDMPGESVIEPPELPEGSFRILIVDDETINRQVLLQHLNHQDYTLLEAESGPDALATIEAHPCDLIFLDIMMPRMSGYEVSRRLRQTYSAQDLPIIFLTAKNSPRDLIEAFAAGASDYLVKPIQRDELIARANAHLRLRKLSRGLEALVDQRTRDLAQAQRDLMNEAHLAGMAELAANILHEVGNALNSVQTSALLMRNTTMEQKPLQLFQKIVGLFREQHDNLDHYFADPEQRSKVTNALSRIAEGWSKQSDILNQETSQLLEYVMHMEQVLRAQQEHAQRRDRCIEAQDLNQILRQALQMESAMLEELNIVVELQTEELPDTPLERSKLMRILFCLIKNACEAIVESRERHPSDMGKIRFATKRTQDQIQLTISDNGIGIPSQHLTQIFTHGFSTRDGQQGFGLHYCANAMREMGGDIKVDADENGACFNLVFPLKNEYGCD